MMRRAGAGGLWRSSSEGAQERARRVRAGSDRTMAEIGAGIGLSAGLGLIRVGRVRGDRMAPGPPEVPGARNWHWHGTPWTPGTTAGRGSAFRGCRSAGTTTARCSCSWATAMRRGSARTPWPPGPRCPPRPRPSLAAARYRASNLIHMGKYSPPKRSCSRHSANPGRPDDPTTWHRELIRLYRSEGRFDDMRRVLRASWCRSTDPPGVLRNSGCSIIRRSGRCLAVRTR